MKECCAKYLDEQFGGDADIVGEIYGEYVSSVREKIAEAGKAQNKAVEAFYRQACRSWRSHYNAWHEYGEWVARSGASLDTMRIWVRGCARGMRTSRQPLWDFFTPYFARVAREKGAQALADAIVELYHSDMQAMKRKARAYAEKFSWNDCFVRQLELYREIAARAK